MHIYAQKETKFSLGLVLVTSNRGKVASQLPGLLGKVAVQVLFKKVVSRLLASLVPFPSSPQRETREPL